MQCLDSTILVDLLREIPAARAKIDELEREGPLVATEVGAFELHLGIQRLSGRRRDIEQARVEDLLAQIEVLPLERRSAVRAAEIAGVIRRRGQTISLADLFTSAIALGHGYDSIVTRDIEDFRKVPGLHVETY